MLKISLVHSAQIKETDMTKKPSTRDKTYLEGELVPVPFFPNAKMKKSPPGVMLGLGYVLLLVMAPTAVAVVLDFHGII